MGDQTDKPEGDAIAVHRYGLDTYATPKQVAQEPLTQRIDPTVVEAAQGHRIREERNSGILGGVKAVVGGTVSGLTGGLVSPFEEAQEFRPFLGGGGQIIGAVLPAAFGDEEGLIGTIAHDPLAIERAGGAISSKALYAGEIGADAGTAAKAVERGLVRTGAAMDDARAAGVGIESADAAQSLEGLDGPALRARREQEVSDLVSKQGEARQAAVADLGKYRQSFDDANPWLVVDAGEDSKRLSNTSKALRSATDDIRGLTENPKLVLKPLRIQEQTIEGMLAREGEISESFAATNKKLASDLGDELATLPDSATHVELSGKLAKRYGTYADVKVGKGAVSVAKDDAAEFLDALKSGNVHGAGQESLGKLKDVLAENRALQQKIEEATVAKSELSSPMLSAIDNAKEALSVPKKEGLVDQMLKGSVFGKVQRGIEEHVGKIPFIGPMIGAKAAELVSDLVFGRMGKVVAEGAERTQEAVKAFVSRAARSPAAITAPVLATKTLAKVAFGPSESEPTGKETLPELFKARTAEIKAQTAYGPSGKPEMTPQARDAMAARFDPIRAHDPVLADKFETLGAKRIEFLSDKIPRRPDLSTFPSGPDHWQPSDMAMRTFARYVAAVEDPGAIEERLATGMVTPEDAEVMREVYPERYAHIQQEIMTKMGELKETLPYQKRLALSIFARLPVDGSMDPRIVSTLQSAFVAEKGSEGGTQAPTAQPAFGSVKKSVPEPTPAQSRSG